MGDQVTLPLVGKSPPVFSKKMGLLEGVPARAH